MKRYIINIMGPIAVGKTTVIEELKDYLPKYSVFGIDYFRIAGNNPTPEGEMHAWIELFRHANSKKYIILESSGTSMNLAQVIAGLNTVELELANVLLQASSKVREERWRYREARNYQAPPMYFPTSIDFVRDVIIPPTVVLNTEKKQPYELAAEIVDLLPADFMI